MLERALVSIGNSEEKKKKVISLFLGYIIQKIQLVKFLGQSQVNNLKGINRKMPKANTGNIVHM
jgi:hypothetical protein